MGYNGSRSGEPHCEDVGCLIDLTTGRCCRAYHAEYNALLLASRTFLIQDQAQLWCTHHPCNKCLMNAVFFGIRQVNFFVDYSNEDLVKYLSQLKEGVIKIVKHPLTGPYTES